MNLYLTIMSALRSLRRHIFRSILTTLGIIIGTVAIIFVMSIGEGAKVKINKEIKQLGTNFILILSASQKRLGDRSRVAKPILTPEDLEAIKNQCEDIALISAGTQLSFKLSYGGKTRDTIIGGCSENYLEIRDWPLAAGTFFTEQQVRSREKVALLGKTVIDEVFGGDIPLGKIIRIKGVPFTIIGALTPKGKRPDGNDQDDVILAPISTVTRRLIGGKEMFFAFVISAKSKDRMEPAAAEIKSILRQMHKIKPGDDEDFTIFSQDDIARASDAALMILNLLLFLVASISLIVGGIGIMNIMLVTVNERTKEIGIRMALGATTQNILKQFILEAIIICLLGGIVGILMGIGTSILIGSLLGWPIFISSKAIILSLTSSITIGVFFGYYPAHKASLLDPVTALAEK